MVTNCATAFERAVSNHHKPETSPFVSFVLLACPSAVGCGAQGATARTSLVVTCSPCGISLSVYYTGYSTGNPVRYNPFVTVSSAFENMYYRGIKTTYAGIAQIFYETERVIAKVRHIVEF